MDLKDTVAIVTGGASGLGEATALLFSQKGAQVAILDRNRDQVEAVSAKLNVLGIVCDITSEKSLLDAIVQVKAKLGVARICVNCAGILEGNRVVSKEGPMELEDFRHVVEVDLIGTFNVIRLVLAEMVHLEPLTETLERGVVINTSSTAAWEGQLGQAAYSASKGGVASMTLPIAREMATFGIRIACIAPGVFETPMIQRLSEKVKSGLVESAMFPKRLGQPKEYASLVAHIVNNPMINGDIIRLDGAARMPPH